MRNPSDILTEVEHILPDSIRKKYIRKFLLVVAIVSILILVLGVYTQLTVAAELTDNRNEQLEAATELTGDNIHQWMAQKNGEVGSLASDPTIKSLDSSNQLIRQTLKRKAKMTSDTLVAIHYIDPNNETILISTNKSLEGETLQSRNLTWQTGSGSIGLGGINQDLAGPNEIYSANNQSLIAFSKVTDNFQRAIVTVYDLETRSEQFRNVIEGGTTEVVASSGTILFPANGSQALESYPGGANATVLKRGENGTSGTMTDGSKLVTYAPVNGSDWTVVKTVPKSNAYALKQTIQNDLIVLLGAALLGLGILTVFVGRDVLSRVENVSNAAETIAQGQLAVTIEDEGRILGHPADQREEV